MTDQIESARLVLRRMVDDDLPFFTRIHAMPEVARYLGHGRLRSVEESLAWLQSIFTTYEELGLGPLAVVRKSDGALMGRCGLSDLAVESGAAPNVARVRPLRVADFCAALGFLLQPVTQYAFSL